MANFETFLKPSSTSRDTPSTLPFKNSNAEGFQRNSSPSALKNPDLESAPVLPSRL